MRLSEDTGRMKYQHRFKRGTPKPFCQTCKVKRVRNHTNKFCSQACVPRSIRQDNCQRGRKTFAYRRRAQLFRADLARIDKRIPREELMAVVWTIYKRAYNSGFQVGKAGGQFKAAVERGAA